MTDLKDRIMGIPWKKMVFTDLVIVDLYERGKITKGQMRAAWVFCGDLPSYEKYESCYKRLYGDFHALKALLNDDSDKELIEELFGRNSISKARNTCDVIKQKIMGVRRFWVKK